MSGKPTLADTPAAKRTSSIPPAPMTSPRLQWRKLQREDLRAGTPVRLLTVREDPFSGAVIVCVQEHSTVMFEDGFIKLHRPVAYAGQADGSFVTTEVMTMSITTALNHCEVWANAGGSVDCNRLIQQDLVKT